MPTSQQQHAKLDDVFKNLRDARKLGVRFVDFTGGEPLLHVDLPEMLRYAKKLGYHTTITTNCLRYEHKSERLRGLVDFLHFSLDALQARQHDTLRGRSTFDQVMHSLDVARDLGEKPDLLFTVSSQNINQIAPLADFARALGLMLVVNPVFSYASVTELDVALLKKLESYASRPYVYVNTAFHRLRRAGGNQRRAPRCRVVDSTIVISPESSLILPCFHFWQQALEIGGEMQDNFQMEEKACQSVASDILNSIAQDGDFSSSALTQSMLKKSIWLKPRGLDYIIGLFIQYYQYLRSLKSCISGPRGLSHSKSVNELRKIQKSALWRFYQKNQGRFDFCQGCTLNCYFDPSFLYKADAYFGASLLAKSRYWWDKNIRSKFETRAFHRPAQEIAAEIMEHYDLT
jgi:organic radical activating enzyme